MYRFVVKRGPEHTLRIAAEPASGDVVFEGVLGFELNSGVTNARAREIANDLNTHIQAITLTTS
jgi:hypothetical protein